MLKRLIFFRVWDFYIRKEKKNIQHNLSGLFNAEAIIVREQ